jgi:uncharacterized protein (DUF924 family)
MRKYQPAEVLDFWFSDRVSKLWFQSTPEFDQELKERFEPLLESAMRGELGDWAESPEGALALVIVLDQFPLNMYRGDAKSFSTGDQALAVAKAAIARGFDRGLSGSRLSFLYLPFMHSESLADQEKSVELYERAGLEDNLWFARHHRELIRRFGRFPHRNAALGRDSTAAEKEYLASKVAFLG